METNLELKRRWFSDKSTIGEMRIESEFECFTLEDTVRKNGIKVYGETAIPSGRYEIVISYSNKFKRILPLLLNVPNFSGVRIHSGNSAIDSHGCILVGQIHEENFIGQSRLALQVFFPKLQVLMDAGKVFINVLN